MRSRQFATELEPLTVQELRQAGLELPGLESITVEVAHSGGRKRHVPAPQQDRWRARACQHAPSGPGEPAVLIDIWDEVCVRCRPGLALTPGQAATWHVACQVVHFDAELGRRSSDTSPRTWLGYARALAAAPWHLTSKVVERLDQIDGALADDRDALAHGWQACLTRWEDFLSDYGACAPAVGTATAASAACEKVAGHPRLHQQGETLARIVGAADTWGRPYRLAGLVLEAWKVARSRGGDAAASRDSAISIAGRQLAGRPVRDVSLLPRPSHTPYQGECSVAAWAEREFDHVWREIVAGWIDLLEDAYQPGEGEAAAEQLILVGCFPLTRDRDRDLSYLSQFPQRGRAVPAGHRPIENEWGVAGQERCEAVVLQVPQSAARHAVQLTEHDPRQDITLGPVVAAGDVPAADQILDLLRTAYPYLPEDVHGDGARPRPTQTVLRARADLRPRHDNVIALRPDEDARSSLYDQAHAFREGRQRWVPDDTAAATQATRALTALLDKLYHAPPVEVTVETGRRPATGLHRLTGTLLHFDDKARTLELAPDGDHDPLIIPLHRIVAVTGAPEPHPQHSHLGGGARQLGWSDYEPAPQTW
ncbi:hypothetical protein GCM10010411_74870 [Actinomadura fulvescens]|uniref:DUF2397 family protein n=1 Tax=Actinomadura fulvescens TaxID=46160 RepID=A0ABP6CXF4_9ACTN